MAHIHWKSPRIRTESVNKTLILFDREALASASLNTRFYSDKIEGNDFVQ